MKTTDVAARFEAITANVERAVLGNPDAVRLALICLLAEGHLLIEDIPGVGKTTLAKSLAASIHCEWRRIQFTPDLLPSDVTGVMVYNREHANFEFRPGGVFANIVLADEINRASPKTQAALLEAMEEAQVTVEATTYPLPRPFMVIATQNPLERQGTYPLPDSQLDRFLMRVSMGYPGRRAEMGILEAHGNGSAAANLEPVIDAEEVVAMLDVVRSVHVAPSVRAYILELADRTRNDSRLALGVSPRAALALMRAARAAAAASGRDHVLPDDVRVLTVYVLEHRLVLTVDARLQGLTGRDMLLDGLQQVPVPVGRAAN